MPTELIDATGIPLHTLADGLQSILVGFRKSVPGDSYVANWPTFAEPTKYKASGPDNNHIFITARDIDGRHFPLANKDHGVVSPMVAKYIRENMIYSEGVYLLVILKDDDSANLWLKYDQICGQRFFAHVTGLKSCPIWAKLNEVGE